VLHLHQSTALASLVKDIKIASSMYIKANNLFPNFVSWQEGYGAFTYSIKDKGRLIAYVKRQEIHHNEIDYEKEFIQLLKEHQIQYDEKSLFENSPEN
jgi:hypothetical protein